jgi:hypothetical protein
MKKTAEKGKKQNKSSMHRNEPYEIQTMPRSSLPRYFFACLLVCFKAS